eukprot:gene17740-24119_t
MAGVSKRAGSKCSRGFRIDMVVAEAFYLAKPQPWCDVCLTQLMPHRTDPDHTGTDWHAQELLLMREVMKLVGRSLAPAFVLREMLHLMSELLGLNRGRMVLADDATSGQTRDQRTASIRHAYGLTAGQVASGVYRWGEGITGRVLQTGLP